MKICRIHISVYFAVLIACIIVLDHTGFAVLALLCAAFHEAGHFAALRAFGVPVEEIAFKIFGVNIRLGSDSAIGYQREIVIALAGCMSNLLFAALAVVLNSLGMFVNQTNAFIFMNLLLCAFNALPVGPLDGGRALEAFFYSRFSCAAARRASDAVSAVFIVPLVFAGVYLVAKTGYNFSLILAAVYLVFALVFKGSLIKVG